MCYYSLSNSIFEHEGSHVFYGWRLHTSTWPISIRSVQKSCVGSSEGGRMVPRQGQCLEFNMTLDTRPMRLREKAGEEFWSLPCPNVFHQSSVNKRESLLWLLYRTLIQQKKSSLWFSPNGLGFYLFLLKVSHSRGRHCLDKISSRSQIISPYEF